jgi:hypothetical protein
MKPALQKPIFFQFLKIAAFQIFSLQDKKNHFHDTLKLE